MINRESTGTEVYNTAKSFFDRLVSGDVKDYMHNAIVSYGDDDDAFHENFLEYTDDYADAEAALTVEEVRAVYGDEAAEQHKNNLERLKLLPNSTKDKGNLL